MWLKLFILNNILLIKIVVCGAVGERCIPSDTEKNGSCELVTDCEDALRALQKYRNHPYSRCGFFKDIEIVCCPRPAATNKYDNERKGDRIADRECKKIVDKSIPPLGLHIIGGETVSPGEFPHMVALGYENGDTYLFQCGGSLVSEIYVLTAAHCIDTLDQVKPTIARLGVIDITGDEYNPDTDIKIAEITNHPKYVRNTKYHDLSLLRLEKEAKLMYSSNLSPACLYTSERDPPGQLTVTGWGKTSNSRDTKSNTLLKANVSLVANSKCGESYTNWRKLPVGISSQQICAGDPQGLKDTCQGDSGGPLQGLTGSDGLYRLVGVTSFGRGCGSPVPGVYTRVSHYLDWIESVVWPN